MIKFNYMVKTSEDHNNEYFVYVNGLTRGHLYISFYNGPKPEKIMVTNIYMNYIYLT